MIAGICDHEIFSANKLPRCHNRSRAKFYLRLFCQAATIKEGKVLFAAMLPQGQQSKNFEIATPLKMGKMVYWQAICF